MSAADDLLDTVRGPLARYLRRVAARLLDSKPHERSPDYVRGYRDGIGDAVTRLTTSADGLDPDRHPDR